MDSTATRIKKVPMLRGLFPSGFAFERLEGMVFSKNAGE